MLYFIQIYYTHIINDKENNKGIGINIQIYHLICLTMSLCGFFMSIDNIIVTIANIKINKKIKP